MLLSALLAFSVVSMHIKVGNMISYMHTTASCTNTHMQVCMSLDLKNAYNWCMLYMDLLHELGDYTHQELVHCTLARGAYSSMVAHTRQAA